MNIPVKITLIFSISLMLLSPVFSEPGVEAGIPGDGATRDSTGSEEIFPDEEVRSNEDLFDFELNITYVILTVDIFYDKLEPFRDWKIKKGVPAHIFTYEEIKDRYPGKNKEAKIHNFLQELRVYKPAVEWLLIVGDHELIPAPVVHADINASELDLKGLQSFAYSDHYYAGLDTDWDHDNDGIFGERIEDFDWTAELNTGRLPVSNTNELETVLKKLMTYEKNPPRLPPNDNWYHNVILAGAVMDVNKGPNIPDNSSTWQDDGYNDYKDNALEVSQKVRKTFSPTYNFIEFYDYHQLPPGNYTQQGDTLNEFNLLSSFNNGAFAVNLVSHGFEDGDGHVEYTGDGENVIWTTFLGHEEAWNSLNGYKLPLVYSSSCTVGNFTETGTDDEDTSLEKLLTAPNGGAVGFVGASVITYRGEFRENDTSFGNWWLNVNFWQMFNDGDHKPGRLLYRNKVAYESILMDPSNPHRNDVDYQQMFRINILAYNYLGDPELSIWTEPPKQFAVEFDSLHSPQAWSSPYTVRVKNQEDGEPVKNARVAISGDGQYGWAETNEAGEVQLELNVKPDETYDLTVTADNYLPYETQFDVEAALNLEVVAGNLTVDKNRLNKGAQTNITLKFKNTGTIAATEVELGFYDGRPNGENLIGSVYAFENVQPGDSRTISVPWIMPGGDHDIHAVLDPSDILMESYEDDNTAVVSIYENNKPYFYKLPTIPINEDQAVNNSLLLSNYVWDEDFDDVLTYDMLIGGEPNCKVTIDENNYIDIDPAENWHGTCNVTVRVTDSIDSSTAYILIEVASVNDPPVLRDIESMTAREDQWFEVKLFGYDYADGDKVLFETDMLEVLPALVENDNFKFNRETGELKVMPDNSMVGEHRVKFRVVDENGGASPWQEVMFTVINEPDPPVFEIDTEFIVEPGKKFQLDVIVTDPDPHDELVYWDDSDLFDIDPDTGRIEFTPGEGDAGSHEITIFVSDGNLTVEETITIEVEGPDRGFVFYATFIAVLLIVGALISALMIMLHKRKIEQIRTEKAKRILPGKGNKPILIVADKKSQARPRTEHTAKAKDRRGLEEKRRAREKEMEEEEE